MEMKTQLTKCLVHKKGSPNRKIKNLMMYLQALRKQKQSIPNEEEEKGREKDEECKDKQLKSM